MEISKGDAISTETELRRRAEEQLNSENGKDRLPQTTLDTQHLIHELQVHQIELEMQNAELRNARNELEIALSRYKDLYDFAPVGYFTLDRAGIIHEVNLAGAGLIGAVRSRLIGHNFGQYITDTDHKTFTDFLTTVLASSIKASCEVALRHKGKQPITVQLEAMVTASGLEYRFALFDITHRKNRE